MESISRMSAFLQYFNLGDICAKLETAGIFNLDQISYDLYRPDQSDVGNAVKKSLRKLLLKIMTRREFMQLAYVLQFYDYRKS